MVDRLEAGYNNSKFRTSMTQQEGHVPARVVQGYVTNINLTKWTVDIIGQYDRKKWFNIQVGSPYLHHSNGEGISIFPEVGATAMVCLPSDSSPPFVLAFVMPMETVDDSSTDAPQGTTSHGQQTPNATAASFSGGRPAPKPGDIWMRTRDNNFVILHRGGVVQIGATELAQRIYIPLNNFITDVSQNYQHYNSNGSIVWGMQLGASQTQIPSQFMQTFRVFATDQYADIKVAAGKVYSPVPEPDGGQVLAQTGVGQGDNGQGSNPIIYEVTVSPKGFVAETGALASSNTPAASVFKFTFDRTGNTLLRTEGNFTLQTAKTLLLKVNDLTVEAADAVSMTAVNGFDIDGGQYAHIKGQVVRLGQGISAVARLGDVVTIQPSTPISITFGATPIPGVPAVGVLSLPISGTITTGNPAVKA
jgi:hypothetical protein